MRGTVCAYHGKSEGYYRSTACRNVCIHCGKRNGIQLSYGTGAGKECVAAVYVGTPRYAALKLISLIVQSGIPIYYSGDLDPDGIGIADRLWQRFGNRIQFFGMSPEDYRNSLSKEVFGENGRKKLEHIWHPLLRETAELVRKTGKAGYQENILKELSEKLVGCDQNQNL